jgi:hypothetical protein
MRHHAVPVEWDDFDPRVWKFIRQKTGTRPEAVVRIRNGKTDRLDADFEGVARLGAFDVNRPGENVSARPFIGDFFVNRPQRRFDLIRRDTRRFQPRGAVGDQRLDLDGVAGAHAQCGRRARGVIAPHYGFWAGLQLVRGRLGQSGGEVCGEENDKWVHSAHHSTRRSWED